MTIMFNGIQCFYELCYWWFFFGCLENVFISFSGFTLVCLIILRAIMFVVSELVAQKFDLPFQFICLCVLLLFFLETILAVNVLVVLTLDFVSLEEIHNKNLWKPRNGCYVSSFQALPPCSFSFWMLGRAPFAVCWQLPTWRATIVVEAIRLRPWSFDLS